ncbi:MAG: hypothetical protein A2035_07750 [Nitrospirae bacterium GWA2_42_11]|nr:MAG: hypothetical protein A2035_07750 [Nitrospirae bacterium GWA2_42_11]
MKIRQGLAIAGVVFILFSLLSITGYSSLFSSKTMSHEGRSFEVPEGVTLRWIADNLKEDGFIGSSTLFLTVGKLMLSEKEIMAGEYLFPPNVTLFDIVLAFKYGKVNYRKITILPGYNLEQIGELLASEGLVDIDTFRELSKDKEMIDILALDISSLEGFLYPDTYYLLRGSNPRKILKKMVLNFKDVFTPEFKEKAAELNMTIKDVVTLASIIEKEAVVEKERTLISAVFHNRLKRNMPLQSDPTVIYALGSSFDGDLKREHLTMRSSYNTYMSRGLPPGPIGSPGIESIRAALYPEDVDYLYFVSKNNDTHYFSKNFRDHSRAVAIYQKPLAAKKTIH